MTIRHLALLFVLLLAGACDADRAPLVARDIVVTPARPGMPMRAAYMRLANESQAAVRITHVTSPQFDSVELHETVVEDDVARMRPINTLTIGAGEEVLLQRGGKHLMLMRPVEEDSPRARVALQFYSDDVLLLSVSVATPDR